MRSEVKRKRPRSVVESEHPLLLRFFASSPLRFFVSAHFSSILYFSDSFKKIKVLTREVRLTGVIKQYYVCLTDIARDKKCGCR